MSFNPNHKDYSIVTDAELATVISNFDNSTVLDIVQNSLQCIYTPYMQSLPNLIQSYEMSFQEYIDMYGDEMKQVRENTYSTIIIEISKFFNISVSDSDNDIYTLAYLMYEFFISNFTNNMIYFFTKFIINDASNIYTSLNLAENKKSKDSSTLYAKKVFANPYIGAIFANLSNVINSIVYYDISLKDIFYVVLGSGRESEYLSNNILDKGNFFKDFYVKYLLNEANISNNLTMLKLSIQQNSEIITVDILKSQELEEI